jgi:hypothetical protein
MQQTDIPIIQKTYDLYRALHGLQKGVPKMERHSLWQKVETTTLDALESILKTGYLSPEKRTEHLLRASLQIDMLRLFIRLSFDIKAINQKSYMALQEAVDEIGRMLGGWIKSLKQR